MLQKKQINYLKSLPFSIDFDVGSQKVKIFHPTPIKNSLYWYKDRPEKIYFLMAEKAQIM